MKIRQSPFTRGHTKWPTSVWSAELFLHTTSAGSSWRAPVYGRHHRLRLVGGAVSASFVCGLVLAFFADTFVIRPPQIASSPFTPSIAYSAFSGIHSDSHSESTHAFAPPRGVATRRFRQPIADIGRVKGWLHWRLLGALITGDARAAYSRRIVAPSSSLRPLFFSTRAAPAPLCCAWAIESHPITNQSLAHQPCPSAPVHHVLSSTSQRSRRAPKRKWVWRLETCDGALLSWHRPTRLPV